MDWTLRMKPKGYNTKAWLHCIAKAKENKAWALKTLKTNPRWIHEASEASIQMLGSYLAFREDKIAKDIYDYWYMRACGQSYTGAIDPSARERWEHTTGRKIGPKQRWKYDHTKHITGARRVDKRWIDFKDEPIPSP